MFTRLIAHSPDLQRLVDEGYDLALSRSHNHLLVRHVPYLNAAQEVKYGTLVLELTVHGNRAAQPGDHVARFIGEQPCEVGGQRIEGIFNPTLKEVRDVDLEVDRTFSAKPVEPYRDFYEKVTLYVNILGGPAAQIDPTATARTFPTYRPEEGESVFNYIDTASGRAGISVVSARLELESVAIVGLGGTGAYVLDLVAKTPVKAIHLYDGDVFSAHNAFRAPGAPTADELDCRPKKVDHLARIYQKMHRGVIPHDSYITAENLSVLEGHAFIFLCLDKASAKRAILDYLLTRQTPFVEVSMGLDLEGGMLGGQVNTTTRTGTKSDHVQNRVTLVDGDVDDIYGRNIQIADLNALNAALAVIKWKKLFGFYDDLQREHFSIYGVRNNSLINEDLA